MTMEKYGVHEDDRKYRVLKPIFGKADADVIGQNLSYEDAMKLAEKNPGCLVEPD